MSYRVPIPINEPIRSYAPGTPERKTLKDKLSAMSAEKIEIPLVIGGKEIRTGDTSTQVMPHRHGHVLATWHKAGPKEVELAIKAATDARREWAAWKFEDRAAVFLRAAELLSGTGWKETINASTMLNQSKTAHQSEIDAVCESIDFLRFNVHFAKQIYDNQPTQRARHVESARLSAAGRFRLCRNAVQLHVYRHESVFSSGNHGEHRHLEARQFDSVQQLLHL